MITCILFPNDNTGNSGHLKAKTLHFAYDGQTTA